MTDDIPARIDRNRNKLAELRDAKVSGKDLYDGLTYVIGDLYHCQEDSRTAERLAKIEVREEMKKELDEAGNDCFYSSESLEYRINELKEGS